MNKLCRSGVTCAVFCYLIVSGSVIKCFAEVIREKSNHYTIESAYQKIRRTHPAISLAPEPTFTSASIQSETRTFTSIDGVTLELDIYVPSTGMFRHDEVLVLVHGGGWWQGERENLAPLARALAARGLVTVTPSYRLAPQAPYPAAMHDVRASLDWVYSHAAELGVNKRKILLGGASAGGQIAALTALTFSHERLDARTEKAERLNEVYGLINLDGLSDFTTPLALKHENDPNKKPSSAERWLEGRYQERPQRWQEASPAHHVDANVPPTFFIISGQSRFSAGKEVYQRRLINAGGCYAEYHFQDAPHSFWMFNPWLTPLANLILKFVVELESPLESLPEPEATGFVFHCGNT